MNNNFNLFSALVFLYAFSLAPVTSQEINIPESGYTEICGRMLMIDGIWMSEGIIRADISILESPNSKPITGGYKQGDEITISSSEGCTYYVLSISKTGLKESKGIVVLSKNIPLVPVQLCEDSLIFYEAQSYKIDTLDWNVYSINDGTSGKPEALIKVTYITAIIDEIYLKENDHLWLGGCLYKVRHVNRSIMIDKGKKREPLKGSLSMTKVMDYSYSTGPVIKGEDINKPFEKDK